jgi:hypothetical protein
MDERGRRAALDEVFAPSFLLSRASAIACLPASQVRAEAVGLRLRCAEEKANASALRVEELQAELALKEAQLSELAGKWRATQRETQEEKKSLVRQNELAKQQVKKLETQLRSEAEPISLPKPPFFTNQVGRGVAAAL